jgi:hypothetical protein
VLTDMITGGPVPYIRNKPTDDLIASELRPAPFGQPGLTSPLGARGDEVLAVPFAGQSAALGKDCKAAAVVASLSEDTSRRLRALARAPS